MLDPVALVHRDIQYDRPSKGEESSDDIPLFVLLRIPVHVEDLDNVGRPWQWNQLSRDELTGDNTQWQLLVSICTF
jgi:hypothetical protein